MSNLTNNKKDSEYFKNEIQNIGFEEIKVNKERFWSASSNMYQITTFYMKHNLNSENWVLKTDERTSETGAILKFELSGVFYNPSSSKTFSLTSKKPSIWNLKKQKTLQKHYEISGYPNLENTILETSLFELVDFYVNIESKSGKLEFTLIVEHELPDYLQSIIDFIANLILFYSKNI